MKNREKKKKLEKFFVSNFVQKGAFIVKRAKDHV